MEWNLWADTAEERDFTAVLSDGMKCHLRWGLPESMCEILALVVLEPVLLVLSFWVYDVIYYYVVYFLKELMNGISERLAPKSRFYYSQGHLWSLNKLLNS